MTASLASSSPIALPLALGALWDSSMFLLLSNFLFTENACDEAEGKFSKLKTNTIKRNAAYGGAKRRGKEELFQFFLRQKSMI